MIIEVIIITILIIIIENFLRFYTYSRFVFEFIFKYYILSHKFYFSQNVETDTSGKFFFFFCIIDAG